MAHLESLDTLQEMLMWRRPGGTRSERKFIGQYIEPLGVQRDGCGNLIKRIGTVPVLWSCHTDTVHVHGGIQPVERDGDVFSLRTAKDSNCLGADDTAGVWLMCNMIQAKTEGLYVFHREEETGAVGSKFIAKRTPALLQGIDYAIALDRKGHRDVITHQFGRCCSDAFAVSLATGLNREGLAYKPDSTGIFTDTANYTGLVPECTNLSVGYRRQHSSGETQDGAHCAALLQALIHLPVKDLVVARKAGDDDDWWADGWPDAGAYGNVSKSKSYRHWSDYKSYDQPRDVLSIVREYPEAVADFLDQYGVDEKELWDYVENTGK